MSYAVSNQLGGIIVWDMSQDVRPGDTDINNRPIDVTKMSTLYGLNNYTSYKDGGANLTRSPRSPRVWAR
jgi:GH18 family chitinase